MTGRDSTLTEQGGIPPPPPRPIRGQPPNLAQWAIAPQKTTAALYNTVTHSFRYTSDEALKANLESTRAINRDMFIYSLLTARITPVSQFPGHFEALDDSDPRQIEGIKTLERIVTEMGDFEAFKKQLLYSIWFGRTAVQTIYRYDFTGNRKRLIPYSHHPIHGDKLVFKWDGRVGVRVNQAFYKGPIELCDLSPVHFFDGIERETITVCKFEPADADYFEGDMAGKLHGVGLRNWVYWYWWTRQNVQALMFNFLERVASGWTVGYYISGDQASREEVTQALQDQLGNLAMVFPRLLDGTGGRGTSGVPGIERIEPSGTAFQLFMQVIDWLDSLIRFAILGQELGQAAGPTGLGSGLAEAHQETFDRILRSDAKMLENALNRDFFSVLARYNCPDIPAPRYVLDIDKPNIEEIMQAAEALYQMGQPLDGDYLASVAGLPKPEPGANILSSLSPMQPAAVGAIPQGVPMAGNTQVPPGMAPGGPQGGDPSQGQPQAVPGQNGAPQANPAVQGVRLSRRGEREYLRQLARWREAQKRQPRGPRAMSGLGT